MFCQVNLEFIILPVLHETERVKGRGVPYSSKFSWFKTFHEIAENHININVHDKNFMIVIFFCDYCCAAAPAWTIYVVALPIIFTHGVGLEVRKREEKQIKRN